MPEFPLFRNGITDLKGLLPQGYGFIPPLFNLPAVSDITDLGRMKLTLVGAVHRYQINSSA